MALGPAGAAERPGAFGEFVIADVLGVGTSGVVYRAAHRHSGEACALKTVRVRAADHLWSIRREIHTLIRLRHPGVVRILAAGVEDGVPWYAMELLDGESLRARIDRGWGVRVDDRASVLDLVCHMSAALGFIHEEGVVHGDLKPENVFLRGRQPVLADFGVARRVPGAAGRETLDGVSGLAGTVAYMAPEHLGGEAVDARADLYALGCILFELLAGRPPFEGAEPADVALQHLTAAPPPLSRMVPDVPAELDRLVLALLEKRPRDRVGHAADVIAALVQLGAAAPDSTRGGASARTLYRPALLGREGILTELIGTARRAVHGAGAGVLLGGESGIGKTYVAAELARRCANRMRVVTASCGPDGAASSEPLHALRPLLLAVADRCLEQGADATDRILGSRGRALAIYEPALRGLPGQDRYPPAPTLTGPGARDHVLACLAETLSAFAAEHPLLLVVDDLQWADELTLRFLETLPEGWLARQPLLLLATHRAEDPRGEIAALRRRQDVVAFELDGLRTADVQALVNEMLALEEAPAALGAFLARQSQGNPFYVAEYLRLAVGEGTLRRTSARTVGGAAGEPLTAEALASLSLPGTVRDLVRRRLDRLGSAARVAVEVGSIVGREFEGALVQAASDSTDGEFMGAIAELLRRQVVEEATPGRYRFVHDKLAEIASACVPADRRGLLHAAVARRLEAGVTPVPPELYARLAHHWSAAAEDAKALDYLGKAGLHAFAAAAYADAADLLRRALALADRAGGVDPATRAHWEVVTGRAEHGLGDLIRAEDHARSALRALGHAVPSSPRGWKRLLLAEALKQGARRLGLRRGVPAGRRVELERAAEAAMLLIHRFFYVDDAPALLASSLRAVNLAERAGKPEMAPRAYLPVAYLCGMLRRHRLAARYFRTAHAGAERLNDPGEQAYCHAVESVYHGTFGRWDAAEAAIVGAERSLRGISDPFLREMILTTRGHVEYFTGRYADALGRYEEVLRSARARGNTQTTAWGLFSIARSLVALDRFGEARPSLEEAAAILERRPELQSEIICLGLLALVSLRLGDGAAARRLADVTLARVRRARPAGFPALVGYAGMLEAYCALAEAGDGDRRLVRDLAAAERALGRFARFVPMAIPTARAYRDRVAALRGHPPRPPRVASDPKPTSAPLDDTRP